MSLNRQEIPIVLSDGVDTKTDFKLATKPITMDNLEFTGKGTPKKRAGFSSLSTDIDGGGTVDSGHKLHSIDGGLLLDDGKDFYAWSEGLSKWRNLGKSTSGEVSKKVAVLVDGINSQSPEYGRDDNFEYFLGQFGTSVKLVVKDRSSGKTILSTDLRTGTKGKILILQNKAVFIVQDNTNLFAYEYDSTTNSASLANSFPNVGNQALWSACTDGTNIILTRSFGSSNYILRAYRYDDSYNLSDTFTNGTESQYLNEGFFKSTDLMYDSTTDRYYALYFVDNGGNERARYYGLDNTFSLVEGPTTLKTGAATQTYESAIYAKSGKIYATYSNNVGGTPGGCGTIVWDVAGGSADFDGLIAGYATPCSRYFEVNGEIYLNIFFRGTTSVLSPSGQESIFTVTPYGEYISKQVSNEADGYNGFGTAVSSVTVDGDSFIFPARFIYDRVYDQGFGTTSNETGITLVSVNLKSKNIGPGFEHNDALVMNGAVPSCYDGLNYFDAGFAHFPAFGSAVVGAGGSVDTGLHEYRLVYSFQDNLGNVWRSAPSDIITATTTAGNNTVTVTYPNLFLDRKPESFVEIYRTEVGGSVFHLIGKQALVKTSLTSAFVDTASDANLITQQILYTDGGVLENGNLFPTISSAVVSDVVHFIDAENRQEPRHSKILQPRLGIETSPFLQLNIPGVSAEADDFLTTVFDMDGKVILCRKSSISVIFGEPPNNLGEGSTYSKPKTLASDVGCIQPNSVVRMPSGYLFQSDKGIYMLDRSLAVLYAGADVEQFNGETITSAYLKKNTNQIRFTTQSNKALIYDYLYKQWSTFSNYAAESAVFWNGNFVHATTAGVVNVENATFQDNGSAIVMEIETNWIKLNGIQNFQRIYYLAILGEYKSEHTLKLEIWHDFTKYAWNTVDLVPLADSSYNITTKPTNKQLYAGVNDGSYQFDVHMEKQKCEAIKFRIYDVPNASTPGESLELTGLTITAGIKRGRIKLPENKTA